MFWSGIHTQEEGQHKKRQMNKQHCLAKRLKREIVEEPVKYSIQEEDSVQKFEDSVYEESRGAINENQEKFSENIEEIHRVDTKQEEGKTLFRTELKYHRCIRRYNGFSCHRQFES